MKKIRILILFLLTLLLLPVHSARADTGPKPTMEFAFSGEPLTITSGILYECEQSDCSDASPLKELGPQRFTCEANSCSATAYGFAKYHRIEIEFSDGKTRQSNIFQTAGFDSKYKVTVNPDDLLVEAQLSLTTMPSRLFLVVACVCTLVAGAIIIGLIIFLVRRSRSA
jgi:hypothetical protein